MPKRFSLSGRILQEKKPESMNPENIFSHHDITLSFARSSMNPSEPKIPLKRFPEVPINRGRVDKIYLLLGLHLIYAYGTILLSATTTAGGSGKVQ
jgi:hypothetical protein